MLKHNDIIETLSIGQKLSLLACGHISDAEASLVNLPIVKAVSMEEVNYEGTISYPSINNLANSWNPKMVFRLMTELSQRGRDNGKNAVVTSNIAVKTSAYKSGMSEDPILCGKILSAMTKGIANAGSAPILSSCSLSAVDVEYLDSTVNRDVLRDYIIKPFDKAIKSQSSAAIVTSPSLLSGDYTDVNLRIAKGLNRGKGYTKANTVGVPTQDLSTKELIDGSVFILNGDIRSLESAYNNFLMLENGFKSGRITAEQFETACNASDVLSEQNINALVDRFIEYASACAAIHGTEDKLTAFADKISANASDESLVLLKNEDILPIRRKSKVAVMGQIAELPLKNSDSFVNAMSAYGDAQYEYVGYCTGYNLDEQRSDSLLPNAIALASSVDTVVMFLGFGKQCEKDIPKTKNLTLQANQLALIDQIYKLGKNIIAVICGEYLPDVSFDDKCQAVIFSPIDGSHRNASILKLINGKLNPSAKLTFTACDYPDSFAKEQKVNKDSGKTKVGRFFGYRFFDSSNIDVKYPFGHGLSYTSFEYSKLRASSSGVQLKITNTGSVAGSEVVQVYVGLNNSSIARPSKELMGFEKVYLMPGQSKTVSINFDKDDFSVSISGNKNIEKGTYTAYVGASISDIRLKKSFNVDGVTLANKTENLSDFVHTQSNIVSGKYTLETKAINKGVPKLSIFCSLLILIAGVFDVFVIITQNFESGYLIIFVLLNIHAFIAIIVLILRRMKVKKANRGVVIKHERENEVELLYETELEKLFVAEFKQQEIEKEVEVVEAPTEEVQLDKSLSMQSISSKLMSFMTDSGLSMDSLGARTVVSALAASRLLILKGETSEFSSLLSAFFASQSFTLVNYTDVLESAIIAASNSKHIHVIGGEMSLFENLLIPLSSYASNPLSGYKLKLSNDKILTVPPNVWFILLQKEEPINTLHCVYENAIAINPKLQHVVAKGGEPLEIDYRQFLKLASLCANEHSLSEELWKRLDKFEEYISSHGDFYIGNKEWQRIETFTSVFLACEGDEMEALDSVISAKLLMRAIPLYKQSMEGQNDFIYTLEKIFGEDNTPLCLDVVKRHGL